MEVITALGGIGAAFGLSSSAGLNAYIPLLIVALAARFPLNQPFLALEEPYNLIGNSWVIAILVILLIIETLVDKIPAVDTINDFIQTFIRPTAGAILFAANAQIITEVSPIIALACGLILAGGVHATKGVVRPVVTATTAGTGNWIVSIIEDIAAFILSLVSILVPLAAIILVVFLAIGIISWLGRRRKQNWT